VFAVHTQGKVTSLLRRFGRACCFQHSRSLHSVQVDATQHDEVCLLKLEAITAVLMKTITGIWSSVPLFCVKIVNLVDRTDLFKISNLV
jgi:hypothetical protein